MLYEWGGGMRFSLVGIGWRENVTTNFQLSSINSTIVLRTLLSNGGGQAAGIKYKIQWRWIADLSKEGNLCFKNKTA